MIWHNRTGTKINHIAKQDKMNYWQWRNLNHFLLSEVTNIQWSSKFIHLVNTDNVKFVFTLNQQFSLQWSPYNTLNWTEPQSNGESAGFRGKNAGIRHIQICMVITLRAKLNGAVYCYRSCLWQAGIVCGCVCWSVTTITWNCVHRFSQHWVCR